MQDAIAADNRRVAVFSKTVLVWHRALQSIHKQEHLDGMDQIHGQEDVEWGIWVCHNWSLVSAAVFTQH